MSMFSRQIYGCGFNVIFAGNILRHMYVTEKCIGSSGLSIFGIDYQVRCTWPREFKSRWSPHFLSRFCH